MKQPKRTETSPEIIERGAVRSGKGAHWPVLIYRRNVSLGRTSRTEYGWRAGSSENTAWGCRTPEEARQAACDHVTGGRRSAHMSGN